MGEAYLFISQGLGLALKLQCSSGFMVQDSGFMLGFRVPSKDAVLGLLLGDLGPDFEKVFRVQI